MNKKLTNSDYCEISKKYNIPISSIKALAMVESGGRGGFDKDGRLLIRFEGHKFRSFTKGKFNQSHPEVSYPYHAKHTYCGKNHSYGGFNIAMGLDPTAAMISTSYGMFQPMGFNHEEMGYETIDQMLDDFKKGEKQQLDAFIRLIIKWGLADELRRGTLKDFTTVALRYNGQSYADNNYHNKMFNYKKQYDKENIDCNKFKFDSEDEFKNTSDNEIVLHIPEVEESIDHSTKESIQNEQSVQNAEQITNIDQSAKTVPDSFVPEDKTIQAPAPSNMLSKAWKWLLGLGLIPTTGTGLIEGIRGLSADGTFNFMDVLTTMKAMLIFLLPYLFWIALSFVIIWGLKELLKQISFIVTQYTTARGDMNNVKVIPTIEDNKLSIK